LLISATGQTIIAAKTAFHHRTFQFITTHFVHHCRLKQALPALQMEEGGPPHVFAALQ